MQTFHRRREPDALTLAAATWLAAGLVLLGLTPLPLHDPRYGWSLAFWLLAAPVVVYASLRMRVPVHGQALRGRTAHGSQRPLRR